MIFKLFIFSTILLNLVISTPLEVLSQNKALECAACQFIGISTKNDMLSNCKGCEEKMSECEIIGVLAGEVQKIENVDLKRFEHVRPRILEAFEKCQKGYYTGQEANVVLFPTPNLRKMARINPKSGLSVFILENNSKRAVISEDPSSNQCMLCFLVYDVLKYINYNILENPMLGEVKGAIGAACGFLLSDDLCQTLFIPDTFGAIIRGLQDSLGGFYDLIAVQGFGCPAYADLFGKC